MDCLFGVQFAVKTIQITQVYRNRFVSVKIFMGSLLLLLFWLHLKKNPTPTIQVTNFILILMNFSYISHDLKISLVNSSPEAVLLEIHSLHEGLFFPSIRVLKRENVLPLFWVLEVKASYCHFILCDSCLIDFPLERQLWWSDLCVLLLRVYFIIELVAVRSVTLLKHFLDCCMSVFTRPKKFPQRNHSKRSGDSVRNQSALEKLTV